MCNIAYVKFFHSQSSLFSLDLLLPLSPPPLRPPRPQSVQSQHESNVASDVYSEPGAMSELQDL